MNNIETLKKELETLKEGSLKHKNLLKKIQRLELEKSIEVSEADASAYLAAPAEKALEVFFAFKSRYTKEALEKLLVSKPLPAYEMKSRELPVTDPNYALNREHIENDWDFWN